MMGSVALVSAHRCFKTAAVADATKGFHSAQFARIVVFLLRTLKRPLSEAEQEWHG